MELFTIVEVTVVVTDVTEAFVVVTDVTEVGGTFVVLVV